MEFKKFKLKLREESDQPEEKTAVMAFGRFNPPTIGHEKLIKKVHSVAKEHGASAHVFASHSEGSMKDPLPQDKKLSYLRAISHGAVSIHGSSKQSPSIFHAAAKLHEAGHQHLVVVAGSDRVEEFQKNLDRYNNVPSKHGHYNFKSIKVVSAGQRDPDAEGVEGMSGTKMRDHAREGRIEQFKSGLPDALKPHAEEIANHIRSVKEDYENPYRFDWGTPEGTEYMRKITPKMDMVCGKGTVWSKTEGKCLPIREAYLNNEIFKLHETVEALNGEVGKVVYRGSTYVTLQFEDTKTKKFWVKDIIPYVKEDEEKVPDNYYKKQTPNGVKQIPALFMPKPKASTGPEITYDGYATKNLHTCPGASALLKDLVTKVNLNPKFILQAIMATDQYLGIEKAAKEFGFADEQTVHDFSMKFAIAHDTLNLLGYPDNKLEFMTAHLKDMSDLSMHRDGTFANEPETTIPTFGAGDVVETADAYISYRPENEGDAMTHNRDVNAKSEKEVYHGIDKTMDDQTILDKPIGLVSFKSFYDNESTKSINAAKAKDMQDVNRAQTEFGVSPFYKQMRKSKLQEQK